MKLFLVLAFVGPALSALFGDKPVCPPRLSLSILKHSTAKTDCDLCDYYFDKKGEYYWWCFPDHGIDEKMLADCKRMKELGKDELIRWFYGLDSRYSKCDPPICDCDSCSELAKPTRSFMKVCAPNMTQDVVSEKLGTCNQVYQDQEKLWIFFDDLKTECYSLTGENITLPICGRCSKDDLCTLFVVDTSPSILDHGYLAALRGVSDGFYTLIEDSLGENKSHDRGRPRSKYVIILTDAYNTFLTRDKIKPAVDKIPEDVIIISVGVGYFDPHYTCS
ncbi:hypothetical protein LSH36_883g00048 [Paralvinella palmiformis]|uniref:VWFA domain-containing protein n=1 Tax=Paralvinella palmiformis TaxID=53620 RepID=A0AAD9MU32_9ANNE|nr:hypothetical protein LSH36_883g00048 [Paralvinella palmiformis]